MKYSHLNRTNTHQPLPILLLIVLFLPCLLKSQPKLSPTPATPQIFEEGIVSTSMYERDMAISPDGREMFYTVVVRPTGFQTIVHRAKMKDGNWSAPQVASFSGQFGDLEPAFSADGKKLFFCSNRPLTGDRQKDFDIWVVEKTTEGWSNPQNLGAPVNAEGDEFFPSLAQNGNLYFTATRKNAVGKEDIYIARWENGKYADPEPLDAAINSATFEFNAFVSPDEQYIIFSSYGRAGEKGGGDLYISKKNTDGSWQPARNCTMLNSEKLDYCPFLSYDKKTLYFTSERHNLLSNHAGKPVNYIALQNIFNGILNGQGNIYSIGFDNVLKALEME